jgi:tetratricopeptide (TPR) repeat protein
MMARLSLAALLLVWVLLPAGSPVRARELPKTSPSLVEQGYDAVYNLDYDAAAELFKQAIAAAPNDPAAYRGAAKNAWLRILFVKGTVTTDQYLGKMSSSDLKVPVPPEPWASEFHKNIDRAIDLGEKAVARNYNSASAHYDLGAGLGYFASYTGTIEGSVWGAMKAARRAYSEHEKVLELDSKRRDAGLVVGTYRYIVASLPMPLRWAAYVVGFGGGRETAIKRLQEAAAYPSDAQADARFALVLIYSREGRHEDALATVRGLERSFPRNRLLWLEEGGALLRAGRPAEAEQALNTGIARMQEEQRPRMGGEAAHLHYKRGIARLAQKYTGAAQEDLKVAVADNTGPVWVRGRAHLELGKIADLAGNRGLARTEYQAAAALCETGSDPGGVEAAKKLIEKPYRQ